MKAKITLQAIPQITSTSYIQATIFEPFYGDYFVYLKIKLDTYNFMRNSNTLTWNRAWSALT